jgi:hypothetical protein
MVPLLVLLGLLGLAVLVVGARLVAADGRGLRPPPAVRGDQERMRTWPR